MPVNTPNLGPGGTANAPGGQINATGFGVFSSATSGSAVLPVYAFSETSLGWYQSASSTIAQTYGNIQFASAGTLNINQSRLVSVRTLAASAITAAGGNVQVLTDEVGFVVGGASGASIFIRSGGTIYLFNSAASAIV